MQTDVIYVGNDARLKMQVRDRKTGNALDFVSLGVTRAVFSMARNTVDSDVYPSSFDWSTEGADGKIEIDLTGFDFPAGSYGARLVIYYPTRTSGVVVADGYPVNVGEDITGTPPTYYAQRRFDGAVCTGTPTITGVEDALIEFDTEVLDTRGFFSPASPGVFIIPAGINYVNMKLIIDDCLFTANPSDATSLEFSIESGDALTTYAYWHHFLDSIPAGGGGQFSAYCETGPIAVTAGDEFGIAVYVGNVDDTTVINSGRFTLEVLG